MIEDGIKNRISESMIDEDKMILENLNTYLELLYKKFRLNGEKIDDPISFHIDSDQIKKRDVYLKMEQIKTFLKVKRRNRLLTGVKNITNLFNDIQFRIELL